MAFFRAIERVQPSHKRPFADPYATIFLDDGLKMAVELSTLPFIGGLVLKIIQRRGPGALSSGIARTKYIDDLLQQTIRSGVKQVIILGAGKPEELLGYLARFHLVLLEDLDAAEYRERYMPDRKGISEGYEFYRVAFAARQE